MYCYEYLEHTEQSISNRETRTNVVQSSVSGLRGGSNQFLN